MQSIERGQLASEYYDARQHLFFPGPPWQTFLFDDLVAAIGNWSHSWRRVWLLQLRVSNPFCGPERQAADTAEALADSLGEVSDLATKADLAELKAELKAALRNELNAQLRWMVGTMLGVAALAVAVAKLLP